MYRVFVLKEQDFLDVNKPLFRSFVNKNSYSYSRILQYVNAGKISHDLYQRAESFEYNVYEDFTSVSGVTMEIYAYFLKKQDAIYYRLKNV